MDPKINPPTLKTVEELVQKLVELLGIEAKFTLEEKEGAVYIKFETSNPGILIGYHGQTLSSLQLILSMMIYRNLDKWVKIIVDVGDYRQKRREVLERMAASAAQKVKFSKEAYTLPPMSAAERRIIHIALSENPDVVTESQGEGLERRVVVKPKI